MDILNIQGVKFIGFYWLYLQIGGGVEEGEIGIIGDRIEGTMKETITITMRVITTKMVTNLSMRVMKHLDSIVVAMVVFLLIGTI